MTLPRLTESPLVRHAGFSYFPIAFIVRLPFAMMVVGVLTLVVAERDSVALGGLNAAVAGIGTALAGPLLGVPPTGSASAACSSRWGCSTRSCSARSCSSSAAAPRTSPSLRSRC